MTLTMEEKLKMWKAARGERCSSSSLGYDHVQGNGKENDSSCISGSAEDSAYISVKCREFVTAKRQLEPISPSDANEAGERGLSGLSIRKRRPKSSFVNSAVVATTTKVRRSLHSTENVCDISSLSCQILEKCIKPNDDGSCTAGGVGYNTNETLSPLRLATPYPSRDCLKEKRTQICQPEAFSLVDEIPYQASRNALQTPRSVITGPSLSNKSGITAGYSDVSIQTTPTIERAVWTAAHERKEAVVQTTALENETTTKEVITAAKQEAEAMIFQAEVAEQRACEAEQRVKKLEETTICGGEAENLKKVYKEQMQDLRWAHMNEVDTLESTIDETNKMVKQLKDGLELAMSKNSSLQDKLDEINSGTSRDHSHTQ